ncbi:MAG: DUF4143 domain-containing protein, partial [Candidatus Electrothrix sp. AR5]|nr:DUF4143 domain-containing protein [Candidatus Electrothrix sp. AR5]
DIAHVDDVSLVNAGSLCEQFVGQHLLYARPPYEEPELFYWMREQRQASSEVDYVLSVGSRIFPVEVKAGKTGTLKSLQVFLQKKERSLGIRFNADLPSLHEATFSLSKTSGMFRLLSLPLYLVEELPRLIRSIVQE